MIDGKPGYLLRMRGRVASENRNLDERIWECVIDGVDFEEGSRCENIDPALLKFQDGEPCEYLLPERSVCSMVRWRCVHQSG